MNVRVIALAGNPNSGKTTLFNRLTGLHQHVGNYPGITVERRAGTALLVGKKATVIDLPGTYSLISRSKDEAVAFEVLTGRSADQKPELAVIVLDASNLDRNLYLALQILELGTPAVIALNMIDLAEARGLALDVERLSKALGVPVVPVVASEGRGIDRLKDAIAKALDRPPVPRARGWKVDEKEESAIAELSSAIKAKKNGTCRSPEGEAIWLLSTLAIATSGATLHTDDDPLTAEHDIEEALTTARALLAGASHDFPARVIQARYAVATDIAESATRRSAAPRKTPTDRIDAVLLHPVFGTAIFLAVMGLVFESIFSWAEPIMNAIQDGVAAAGNWAHALLPRGALTDLVTDGVIGGVGNVLVFIPQIAILSFFIAVLEDSGYLARAAFITDRLMARVGLHGRAFVPLISGFACAVPAIMATRTIESRKDRLVTILVTPLMSCSARLPVYGLVISALFASDRRVLGFISVGALMFLAMYLLSVTMAISAAFVLKRTILKSPTPPFVLELPPYRRPVLSSVVRRVLDRCRVFVRDAGTVILACSIVLWALLYFPHGSAFTMMRGGEAPAPVSTSAPVSSGVEDSYAGQLGRLIEPAIKPLGFDWKIGIGLLASFAAREVLVSTLGLVYGVGRGADEESLPLREAIRRERDPRTGRAIYTPLVGIGLMVFFVLACQCMSTLAVVRRESGSWRWPALMFSYMTVLAWVGAFAVYQGGRLLGFE
jgi:ferrous iron transport protein B